MVRMAITALALGALIFVVAAKPNKNDTAAMHHNQPFIVNQQSPGGASCYDGDVDNCVTNIGPCVWDVDDSWSLTIFDGHGEGCIFADHGHQIYEITSVAHKRHELNIRVTLDPPLDIVGLGLPGEKVSEYFFDDVVKISNRDNKVTGCFLIDIPTSSPDYELIPYQGGGGGLLGMAIPATLTFESHGKIEVRKLAPSSVSVCK